MVEDYLINMKNQIKDILSGSFISSLHSTVVKVTLITMPFRMLKLVRENWKNI